MILDEGVLADIREQWAVVRRFSDPDYSHQEIPIAGAGIVAMPPAPDDFFNLPLVLAFSVLEQVLDQLKAQGDVPATRNMLGVKMEASKRAGIPWLDYPAVEAGRNDRNDLAHRGRLIDKARCIEHVAAIDDQLKQWGIVTG
jgi:hypothetical protein